MLSKIRQIDSHLWLSGLLGFSFTIGSEVNNVLHIEVSKLFSFFLIISLAIAYLGNRLIVRQIPGVFLLFFIYVAFQMVLNYFSSELADKSYYLLKFILFLTIIPVTLHLMDRKRHFEIFSICYSAGVIVTGLLNILMLIFRGNPNPSDFSIRISGGYLDPNSYGTSAAVAALLLLYMLITFNQSHSLQRKLFALMLCDLLFLNLSQSRSVFLGIVFFMILFYLFSKPHALSKKIRSRISWILPAFIITFFIPGLINPDNMSRLNIVNRINAGKEPRIQIWRDYISVDEIYIFRGASYYHHAHSETTHNPLKTTYDTHNKFLNIYFEFGAIALLLFLLCLTILIRIAWVNRNQNMASAFMLSAMIAWFVFLFFEDYQGSRDYFLLIGFFIAIYNHITARNKSLALT